METTRLSLDPSSSRPLYEQLEALLRSQIESGELRPGDRIPSEWELADTYTVSRVTVRRALSVLVSEGILYRRFGKGTYVAHDKVPYRPVTLFSFSRSMRSLGLTVTSQVLQLRLVPAPPQVSRDLRLASNAEVVLLQRLRYIEGEPMALHTDHMPGHLFAPLLQQDLTGRALTEAMEAVSGLRIASSLDCIEATLARSEEAALLKIHRGAAVLVIRGTAYTREGLPVRCTAGVFRGDHFRFVTAAVGGVTPEVKAPAEAQGLTYVEDRWPEDGID